MLKPEDYFDLTEFEHRDLFAGVDYVWEVLSRIGPYLADWFARLGGPVILGSVESGAWLDGREVYIAPGAVVEPGAYVRAPAIIGPGTVVRHGAYIRGNVVVGRNCMVGHGTELKNAVLLDGAQAPHFAYVGDSVLGNRVNLGAGTVLANFRFGGTPVTVTWNGQRFNTGLRKFGAIVGDNVETGCNAVLAPGTLVGPGTLIYPTASVRGIIPPRSVVKFKGQLRVEPRLERLPE